VIAAALTMVLACGATIVTFIAARALHQRLRTVLTLPVLTTTVLLVVVLLVAHVDIGRYAEASRPLGWWLGPATVALAVPMMRERARLRRHARAVLLAVIAGAVTSIASVIALGVALRLSRTVILSLAPKSVTTPIAMPIAERLGGVPALAAAVVIVTGVLGMAFGPKLLDLVRVRSAVARGLALGTSAHGIGTARAFDEGAIEGAMSGVAMIVSGLVTALIAAPMTRGLLALLMMP
jgi:predicted murein hydrolase (TIGR00659 family)